MANNENQRETTTKESVRIDLVKNENNSIKILKSAENQEHSLEQAMSQIKIDIIDYYDKMQNDIDIRTEQLLMELPDALKNGRDELLERVKQEKEKSLAALAPNSPLVQHKNEYYQRFLQLKNEFKSCGNDEKKREEIYLKLDDLKKKVQVLEEFLDDFKNRTLTFEEVDQSVYSSLIGDLVITNENQIDLDLYANELLAP